jgi:hypothetical protein
MVVTHSTSIYWVSGVSAAFIVGFGKVVFMFLFVLEHVYIVGETDSKLVNTNTRAHSELMLIGCSG